jgi:hypothetical protein
VLEEFLVFPVEEHRPDDLLFRELAPHFHKEATNFLNLKFPEKRIGGVAHVT